MVAKNWLKTMLSCLFWCAQYLLIPVFLCLILLTPLYRLYGSKCKLYTNQFSKFFNKKFKLSFGFSIIHVFKTVLASVELVLKTCEATRNSEFPPTEPKSVWGWGTFERIFSGWEGSGNFISGQSRSGFFYWCKRHFFLGFQG